MFNNWIKIFSATIVCLNLIMSFHVKESSLLLKWTDFKDLFNFLIIQNLFSKE